MSTSYLTSIKNKINDFLNDYKEAYKEITYEEMVKKFAEDNDNTIFANNSRSNAVIIAKTIFNHTQNSIDIISTNMPLQKYFEFIKPELEKAAERLSKKENSHIRIIVRNPEEKETLKELLNEINKNNVIDFRLLEKRKKVDHQYDFIVADGKMWRYEFESDDTSKDNQDLTRAYACFNDTDLGKKLEDEFNRIWNNLPLNNP